MRRGVAAVMALDGLTIIIVVMSGSGYGSRRGEMEREGKLVQNPSKAPKVVSERVEEG